MSLSRPTILAFVALVLLGGSSPRANDLVLVRFEQYLESLRQQSAIPGMSAAIVDNGKVVWARGLGLQDIEGNQSASTDTPYHVGGLTQIISSTLVLQCIERGELELSTLTREFTTNIPEAGVNVFHLLTHTSQAPVGSAFRYDELRFAALTPAVDKCMDQGYREAVAYSVLDRLGLTGSVPGHEESPSSVSHGFDSETLDRYGRVLERVAKSYRVDRNGKASPSSFQLRGINAAIGLISTVEDLARIDAALDDGVLLKPDTLAVAWKPATTADGRSIPHGLGWFVQSYHGERLVWSFGLIPDAYSSLIVKVPNRRLTFILLANSDGLSAPFALHQGDVTVSLFAQLFLRVFA